MDCVSVKELAIVLDAALEGALFGNQGEGQIKAGHANIQRDRAKLAFTQRGKANFAVQSQDGLKEGV